MVVDAIINILSEKIGLNPNSVGESSIKRAINHRKSVCKCATLDDYLDLLKKDGKEIRELIEEVVVPETWFFRNKVPFKAFISFIKDELLPRRKKNKSIRILSIPCATGEEPYSIAITLQEAGVDLADFQIDAIDVSTKSIELAKRACFGKNSFRDVDKKIIEKYFDKTDDGYQIDESIKNSVKFKQGNVLVGSLSPHPGYYDIIFCRNLLIYFDRDTQKSTLEKLHRSLRKSGVLFVGHAEASQVSNHNFERSAYPRSFSFIKKSKSKKSTAKSRHKKIDIKEEEIRQMPEQWQNVFEQIAKIEVGTTKAKKAAIKKFTKRKSKTQIKQKAIIHSLRPVEKLADQGRYEEAQKLCTEYLELYPESAHGHYLLGLINNSLGNEKATESLLKKAIYLDPNHEQALVLSSLLAEKKGDFDAVKSFKRRIERVQKRKVNADD